MNEDLINDKEFWEMVEYVQQFDPHFASELANLLNEEDDN